MSTRLELISWHPIAGENWYLRYLFNFSAILYAMIRLTKMKCFCWLDDKNDLILHDVTLKIRNYKEWNMELSYFKNDMVVVIVCSSSLFGEHF